MIEGKIVASGTDWVVSLRPFHDDEWYYVTVANKDLNIVFMTEIEAVLEAIARTYVYQKGWKPIDVYYYEQYAYAMLKGLHNE